MGRKHINEIQQFLSLFSFPCHCQFFTLLSQQLLYYQNQITFMISSSKSSINAINNHPSSKPNKQELIVEINIGKKNEAKFIRLCDIHNMNYVDQEIKWFIKNNGLKDSAFGFIKELIIKQISHRKDEIYFQCHSICSQNCKCQHKINQYEQKQKQIFNIISFSNSNKRSISKSPKTSTKEPQHIQIKITPKLENQSTNVRRQRNEDVSSFVFNSSFTLPSSVGQKQRNFLTDQLFQNVLETTDYRSSAFFSDLSEFRTKERQNQNKIFIKSSDYTIKRNDEKIVKPLESSFKKNSIIDNSTPKNEKLKFFNLDSKGSITLSTPKGGKHSKMLSTKERKAALMTPQKSKVSDNNQRNLVVLNSENLESMVLEHKKAIKQTNLRTEQTQHATLQMANDYPFVTIQVVLQDLFRKLTANNPPQMKQLHSQYVSYQLLDRQQLYFMGILFEKIDHKELNHLNYTNFKANSLKYCRKQLQELIFNYSMRKIIQNSKNPFL